MLDSDEFSDVASQAWHDILYLKTKLAAPTDESLEHAARIKRAFTRRQYGNSVGYSYCTDLVLVCFVLDNISFHHNRNLHSSVTICRWEALRGSTVSAVPAQQAISEPPRELALAVSWYLANMKR